MYPGGRNVLGYCTLTVSSSAVSFADASPAMDAEGVWNSLSKPSGALITVEDDAIRWRADGTDPSSTEGHKNESGVPIVLIDWNYSEMLRDMTFIRVSTDAKLKITLFK